MMKRIYLLFALFLFSSAFVQAQETEEKPDTVKRVPDSWIHVFRTENGKIRVTTAPSDSIKSIYYAGDNGNYSKMIYEFIENGEEKPESFDMAEIDSVEIGPNVPLLIITTDEPLKGNEIQSKDYFVTATFELKGYGLYDDIEPTPVSIKGRGNSTWAQFPKKPYRLKFSEKVKICGLTKAKNYALLANYIDPTLLRNAIAFKVGKMLDFPYVNSSIPVRVILNGVDKGAYQLTEKIGINKASVNIEETEGILFELDTNYDEPYKFYSNYYRVPVMLKDPDFAELAALPTVEETVDQMWSRWKNDFQAFETALNNNRNLTDYIDVESVVDYLFVYNLTGNGEPGHPKSVYMHKDSISGKYKMGPLWDFDWAYTFGGNYEEEARPSTNPLFSGNTAGCNFFKALIQKIPDFMDMYRERWDNFLENQQSELWAFIDEYAHAVKASAAQNGEIWPTDTWNRQYYPPRGVGSTDIFPTHVENLKKWLRGRIDYIESQRNRNFGLY